MKKRRIAPRVVEDDGVFAPLIDSSSIDETPTAPVAHIRAYQEYLADAFCILFGVTMTLIVHGYQFGRGNHSVYLLDALRRANPNLFPTDWFVTQTLQYHSLFGWMSALLYRTHLIEHAFLAGYLLLAVAMSAAWYGIISRFGGSRLAYLVSVVMFYISAGGEGLGMYQFLQDSSFLPSNVAAVAMLCGIYFWLARRRGWAGAMFGLAGIFHLNYALVGAGLWIAMLGWDWLSRRDEGDTLRDVLGDRATIIGSALTLGLSGINIALALHATASQSGRMPLKEFVDIYVHLRHPHHYDPSSWPIALWLSFLWPTPFALAFGPQKGQTPAQADAWQQSSRFFVIFCGLLVLALVGAGLFYVSETLVQMSLYRFSVFVKLLSCCAAAYFLCESGRVPRRAVRAVMMLLPVVVALILATLLNPEFGTPSKFILRNWAPLIVMLAALLAPAAYAMRGESPAAPFIHAMGAIWLFSLMFGFWNRGMGITAPAKLDSDFLDICRWVRDPKHTPVDSVFIVPPDDESFRLHAERGIVVNFKCVPQLSGELPEWKRRLERVLDVPNLLDAPKPYHATLEFMRTRYAALPAEHLFGVAREMGAQYVVVTKQFDSKYDHAIVFTDPDRDYSVYEVAKQ